MIKRWLASLAVSALSYLSNGCDETTRPAGSGIEQRATERDGGSEQDGMDTDAEPSYTECFLAYVLKSGNYEQNRIVIKNLNTGTTYSPENDHGGWKPRDGLTFSDLSFSKTDYSEEVVDWSPAGEYLDSDVPPPTLALAARRYRDELEVFSLFSLRAHPTRDEWYDYFMFHNEANPAVQPATSTDHKNVVFIADNDVHGANSLWAARNYQSPLTQTPDVEAWPSWFPGGKKIAFSRKGYETDGTYQLFSLTLEEEEGPWGGGIKILKPGALEKITQNPGGEIEPVVSPNGRYITYLFPMGITDYFDVWVLDLQSGERRNLTQSSFYERDPAWMPDSKHVLFSVESTLGENHTLSTLYRISLADSTLEKLAEEENRPERDMLQNRGVRHPAVSCR